MQTLAEPVAHGLHKALVAALPIAPSLALSGYGTRPAIIVSARSCQRIREFRDSTERRSFSRFATEP
jgi:hypothetical protein